MPLQVIQQSGGLGKISSAISVANQIYDMYQKIQKNKYQKRGIQGGFAGIGMSEPKEIVDEEIAELTEVPEAITAPPGLEQFSKDLAGKLEEKRIMMADLLPKGQAAGIDQPDMNTIFNAISGLPLTGDIPFSDITNMIFKNFDKNWSSLAQGMLGQVLGEGLSQLTEDPRQTFKENIGLAKEVKAVLYPEEKIPTEWEMRLLYPEKYKQLKEYEEEGKVPSEWEMRVLYPERYKQLKKGEEELKAPEKTTFTTGEMNYVDKQLEGVTTTGQYETAFNKVKAVNPRLAEQMSSEKVFKDNYDRAATAMENVIEGFEVKEGMFDEDYTNEQVYEAAYGQAVLAAQEYEKATGKTLEVPYASLEEYKKSDIKPRQVLSASTWGKQRSVYKEGTLTSAFVQEMIKEGKTLEDYNPEVLKKAGVNLDSALKYYDKYKVK